MCNSARIFLWTSDEPETNIRVFERKFHDDKWTGCGRSCIAKGENYATGLLREEKGRFSYICVREVKVLDVFSGIRDMELELWREGIDIRGEPYLQVIPY